MCGCSKNCKECEALEQQTATSEILGVIASSPTDFQPVLDVVAENAARLCEANDALILRVKAIAFGPQRTLVRLPVSRIQKPSVAARQEVGP